MPSVTTNSVLIFCEGEPTSLDSLMLHGLPFTIVPGIMPAGGKGGLKSYVRGVLAGQTRTPHVVFRDRDLDAEPPDTPALICLEPGKHIYALHRACVESYFLSGDIMHAYWAENLEPTRGSPPLTAQQFEEYLERAARSIAGYQAVRWGLQKLKLAHPASDLPDKLTSDSGDLPASVAYADCVAQAQQEITNYQNNSAARSCELFSQYAEEFNRKFSDPDFYAQKQHLVWFHGKDLRTAFMRTLPAPVNFPMKHYLIWAAENMSRWHLSHPDILELIQLCSRIAVNP